jgi:hypothetical protein
MCRCLSDILVDVLEGNCDVHAALDSKLEELAEQILETSEIVGKEEPKTECSQLYYWLAQGIDSLA